LPPDRALSNGHFVLSIGKIFNEGNQERENR
jgi:hypothetical protein